jgi:hypothetical protein
MGNASSVEGDNNTNPQLRTIETIINSVLTEEDVFKDGFYNFLNEDVCQKYQVVLESDLNKMLKVEVKSLGESLLLIPREEEQKLLEQKNMKKNEICTRVANHYIRILYVLCLVKYVYNLEKQGELSIAGIVQRHITVTKNSLKIIYCKLEQKNLRAPSGNYNDFLNLDLSGLAGLQFFVEYFLDKDESTLFMRTLRHLFARKSRAITKNDFCEIGQIREIEDMYQRRFQEKLTCSPLGKSGGGSGGLTTTIEKDNLIFDNNWCYAMGHVTLPLMEKDGMMALKLYKEMKARYNDNVKDIHILLLNFVEKKASDKWVLKDMTKDQLDKSILMVKEKVKIFYLQSILDFQDLLDRVKTFPNAIVG